VMHYVQCGSALAAERLERTWHNHRLEKDGARWPESPRRTPEREARQVGDQDASISSTQAGTASPAGP
jgi:hypothetical protein